MHSFPPDLERFVQHELSTGRFQSTDELVYHSLRELRDRQQKREELRQTIRAGLDQLDRGEFIELDGEDAQREFFEQIKAEGRRKLGIQ